jgi:hypothetical protein
VSSGGAGYNLRGFLGTTVMAVVSIALIVYEWDFSRRRVAGEAVVTGTSYSDGRSGLIFNDVVHRVGGVPVEATIRTFYLHLHAGQSISVLYLPDEPKSVELDGFWQRHYGSVMALTLFTIFAVWETLNVQARRRRRTSPLLGDDPAEDSDASEILRRLEEQGRSGTAHRSPAAKCIVVTNGNRSTFVPPKRST